MNYPLVSIIMSSFNHERYIVRCLDSVFKQTYENIEIILRDNCSADNTLLYAKDFCNANAGIRNIRCDIASNEVNLGATKSLNRCLDKTLGKYVFTLWTDDCIHPDCIKIFVQHAEQNPDYHGLFFCEIARIDVNDYYLGDYSLGFLGEPGIVSKKNIWDALFSNTGGELGVVPFFISRESFFKFGKYDEDFNAVEWDLYIRFNGGPGMYYIKEKLYYFRITPDSAGKRVREYADGMLCAVQKYKYCFSDGFDKYLLETKLRILRIYISNYEHLTSFMKSREFVAESSRLSESYRIISTLFFLYLKFSMKRLIPQFLLNFYTFNINPYFKDKSKT